MQRVLFACGVVNGVSRVGAALHMRSCEKAAREGESTLQARSEAAQVSVKHSELQLRQPACLAAGDDVIALGQDVDQFALALVAPLRAEHCTRGGARAS